MNMEIIQWPIFMPQFYTAPNAARAKNASLRFENAYNYVIANSYSIPTSKD
jgi:hypothetical protein